MNFETIKGATPVDPSEIADLIPAHISTLEELDQWESGNIDRAKIWLQTQKVTLTLDFIKLLHYRMFDQTWRWAGKFRTSEKNIGIAWPAIPVELRKLCDDVRYHIDNAIYQPDEIAVRFHYKLVWIHPFSNGNGRHARLMADLLVMQLGQPPFTWGARSDLTQVSALRKRYIDALLKIDRGQGYEDLLLFARS